jgi:hypothetical protein
MPYTINGQSTSLGEEPHQHNGTTYLPFREVIQALGGTVSWDNTAKQATATIGKWTAQVDLDANTADVSGNHVTFSAPAHEHDGKLYVPADFFHQAYGYKVQANGSDVSISL